MSSESQNATLQYNGKTIELPLIVGTQEEIGINISQLRRETGLVTVDPGYVNTGSCESQITYIDGEKGILRYRGIPIEQLASHSSFIETAYLLVNSKLPTLEELNEFTDDITHHTMLREDMKDFFHSFPHNAHPMAILSSGVNVLSTYYPEIENEDVSLTTTRLLGKLPTVATFGYKKSVGQPYVYPTNSLDYSSNFLKMMFSVPAEEYEVDPVVARALDMLLIVHADHEQNCSTSTVRLVGSSGANLYASVSSGISALWGYRHGGANQAVIEMLTEIRKDPNGVKGFIEKVKNKEDGVRLMGFGHRVYKNMDPRAKIIKKACDEVLDSLGINDPLLEIAKNLEEQALKDDYFVSRKLYPNVDFYSGIIFKAIGIPRHMFTVLFAIGRLPGWIAQWKEMNNSESLRIGRPRQIYTGPTEQKYVPIGQRKDSNT